MKIKSQLLVALAGTLVAAGAIHGRQKPEAGSHACPAHEQHQKKRQPHGDAGHAEHLAGVNARGEAAMNFSQTKTTHRFRLTPDGGAIEVSVKDASDAAERERVRGHLKEIAGMFAAGDFSTPFAVHARVPPGAETLKRLKASVAYKYEESRGGGRVRISTRDREALKAVHEFLRFQIEDHHTGDTTKVVTP